MSTYLSLCQKFRKVVGISGSGLSSVLAQSGMNEKITIWIADADELIQRKWADWDFLLEPKEIITALADTATFTLSTLGITDLAEWKRNTFVSKPGTTNYKRLDHSMDYYEYLNSSYYLDAAETGEIERVFIRPSDNAVIFHPTPTATTTVWASYYKAVTRLSADASDSAIPNRFEDAIIYRAKMYYAEHLEDVSLYNSAEKDYMEIMTKLEDSQAPSFKGMQTSNNDLYEDIMVE